MPALVGKRIFGPFSYTPLWEVKRPELGLREWGTLWCERREGIDANGRGGPECAIGKDYT